MSIGSVSFVAHRTHWDYDSLGRLAKVYELMGNCATYWPEYGAGCTQQNTWANYATTTYSYSPLDLLTAMTDQGATVSRWSTTVPDFTTIMYGRAAFDLLRQRVLHVG